MTVQLPFELRAFGDVAKREHGTCRPLLVENGGHREGDVERAAIGELEPGVMVGDRLGRGHRPPGGSGEEARGDGAHVVLGRELEVPSSWLASKPSMAEAAGLMKVTCPERLTAHTPSPRLEVMVHRRSFCFRPSW